MSTLAAARVLRDATIPLTRPTEAAPYVLNPLDYAWEVHRAYLERYAPEGHHVEALFIGMNPGPWGMAQTGVPFGAVNQVTGFLGLSGDVRVPEHTHPKRPIEGLACSRVEVSGDRLWGGIAQCFGTPEAFFERFFISNYCPLVWQGDTGRNLTPDKLPKAETAALFAACDAHLAAVVRALRPERVIGVGVWAEKQAKRVIADHGLDTRTGRILHPSPASPLANRGWLPHALKQLEAMGHPWPN